MHNRHIVYLAVLFEGGLALLALGAGWLLGVPVWESLWWDSWDAALGTAACLPMLLAFWMCLTWPLPPLRRIKHLSADFIRPLFVSCSLIDLALISLLAGVGEELLFRGLLQAWLSRWLGLCAGVLLASAVFGLLHALTPTYAFLAGLMGAYLGGLWLASDNLLTAVVAHGVYDFIALVYLVRSPSLNAPEPTS